MPTCESGPLTFSASPRWSAKTITAALFVMSFAVYALTMATTYWHTDVFGSNWTSWHIATTGSPWIDGASIPQVGHRGNALLAMVEHG